MGKARPKHFATEADLCAAFIKGVEHQARRRGSAWTPFAETAGWDILLVRNADGFQIGIEAKLKLNAKVFAQALESPWHREEGPDCRAVLVPRTENNELSALAPYVGLTVIGVRAVTEGDSWRDVFYPHLPEPDEPRYSLGDWRELMPLRRHQLPDFVP